jgi:hypothetical protein
LREEQKGDERLREEQKGDERLREEQKGRVSACAKSRRAE